MNRLNPLEKEATLAYLNEVHEEHYKRFHEDFGKTISGTIKYQTTFFLDKQMEYLLDLGKVYELANVTVNGVIVRGCICPAYQMYLPENILKAGENYLTVEVTNTLVKQQHNDPFDKYFVQEPSGLIGPVRLLY
jgi:hypothetical protein